MENPNHEASLDLSGLVRFNSFPSSLSDLEIFSSPDPNISNPWQQWPRPIVGRRRGGLPEFKRVIEFDLTDPAVSARLSGPKPQVPLDRGMAGVISIKIRV